jgi:organic radical activating enzyme
MKIPATADSAQITEIFSSLQGEGPYAGCKHLFIRFEECHMHCGYCDELQKVGRKWTIEETIEEVLKLEREKGPHLHVSLTGGEPLLYLPFIKPLIRALKRAGLEVYLETSGVLWRALEEVMNDCAVIAMDLKPASVTHEKSHLEEHKQFLKWCPSRNYFLKMVVSKEIDLAEYDAHIQMVAGIAPSAVLYLQPVTAAREGHEDPELMKLVSELQTRGQKWLKDIRIGLRLHRILNIR